jgi:hypothetical protein
MGMNMDTVVDMDMNMGKHTDWDMNIFERKLLISDIGLGFVQYRNDFDNSIMNGPISE